MIWPTFDSLNVHATRLLEPLEDDSLDKASNFQFSRPQNVLGRGPMIDL